MIITSNLICVSRDTNCAFIGLNAIITRIDFNNTLL